jgi:hypothetical protein
LPRWRASVSTTTSGWNKAARPTPALPYSTLSPARCWWIRKNVFTCTNSSATRRGLARPETGPSPQPALRPSAPRSASSWRPCADWPHIAATTAANLHAVGAANPDAPGLAELVDELTTHSPEFAGLWQRYDIRRRRSEPKTFRHPQAGTITLTNEVLQLSDGQRMSVYQAAPGSTSQDALKLLALLAVRGRD